MWYKIPAVMQRGRQQACWEGKYVQRTGPADILYKCQINYTVDFYAGVSSTSSDSVSLLYFLLKARGIWTCHSLRPIRKQAEQKNFVS